jgi:hypothetical protein
MKNNNLKKSNLNNFREFIDDCDDIELLESASMVLKEQIEIYSLSRRLKELQDNLHNGKKAAFFFFVSSLSEDEIVYAAEKTNGKLKRIEEMKKKTTTQV